MLTVSSSVFASVFPKLSVLIQELNQTNSSETPCFTHCYAHPHLWAATVLSPSALTDSTPPVSRFANLCQFLSIDFSFFLSVSLLLFLFLSNLSPLCPPGGVYLPPGLSSSWKSLLLLLHLHHPPSLLPTAALCQLCCPGAASHPLFILSHLQPLTLLCVLPSLFFFPLWMHHNHQHHPPQCFYLCFAVYLKWVPK